MASAYRWVGMGVRGGGGDIVREHVCMSVCIYARVVRVRIGCAAARCRSGCTSLGQVQIQKREIWRDL